MDVLWHLQVDARGLKAGMAQDVRQSRQVMAGLIEDRGEKVAQVVWEDFRWLDTGWAAERLHISPDLSARKGAPRFSTEDGARDHLMA